MADDTNSDDNKPRSEWSKRVEANSTKILDILNTVEDLDEQLFTLAAVMSAIMNANQIEPRLVIAGLIDLYASEASKHPLDLCSDVTRAILGRCATSGDPQAIALIESVKAASSQPHPQEPGRRLPSTMERVAQPRFQRHFRRRG